MAILGLGVRKIYAVADGKAIPLANITTKKYSEDVRCNGFAVEAISRNVYCPISGIVESVNSTKQVYVIKSNDGLDIGIHIGCNTPGGRGLIPVVKATDRVNAGDLLAIIDIPAIRAAGSKPTIPVFILNADGIETKKYRFGEVRGGKSAVISYVSTDER